MSRLTRDGTAEPSRENKFSGTNADREIFHTTFAICVTVCVCVFFPFVLNIRFVGLTSGVTKEEGHTGFFIHVFLLRCVP